MRALGRTRSTPRELLPRQPLGVLSELEQPARQLCGLRRPEVHDHVGAPSLAPVLVDHRARVREHDRDELQERAIDPTLDLARVDTSARALEPLKGHDGAGGMMAWGRRRLDTRERGRRSRSLGEGLTASQGPEPQLDIGPHVAVVPSDLEVGQAVHRPAAELIDRRARDAERLRGPWPSGADSGPDRGPPPGTSRLERLERRDARRPPSAASPYGRHSFGVENPRNLGAGDAPLEHRVNPPL